MIAEVVAPATLASDEAQQRVRGGMTGHSDQPPVPGSAARSAPPWDVIVLLLFLGAGIFGVCQIAGWDGFACWLIGVLDVLIVRTAWRLFRG